MIEIGSSSREMDERYLRAPGGFAWWYVDLITPEGDGLVLIFSFGLPFLPGYAAATRRGRAELPLLRPSVNLALYERGRESFYLLQEHAADDAAAELDGAARVRIGGSLFRSEVVGGRRVVEATFDCSLPGTRERLTGSVHVEGVARRDGDVSQGREADHLWTPLTGPASGVAEFDLGGAALARLRGRAYHDRNGGAAALHALGIQRWMWGRFPLGEYELIYYLNWPDAPGTPPRFLGMTIDSAGRAQMLDGLSVELGSERRGWLGVRWPESIRLQHGGRPWVTIRHLAAVDDGPFYVRFQSEVTTAEGEDALGWGEICEPERVDLRTHRPLVRMRVHATRGRNSLWLPLFAGTRRGRIARWARSLVGQGAA